MSSVAGEGRLVRTRSRVRGAELTGLPPYSDSRAALNVGLGRIAAAAFFASGW
jgi:hypothetical protein